MSRQLVIAFISVVLLSSFAESQLVRTAGFKGGIAATSVDWEYTSKSHRLDPKSRYGIDVGGFIEWFSHPTLSVTTELHWIQKGFEVSIPMTNSLSPEGDGSMITFNQRIDYISILITAKARIEISSFSIYGLAGPRVDFFRGTKGVGFAEVIDNFRSTELGFTLGIGIEAFSIGPLALGSEVRYSPTLQDSYSRNLLRVRNRSFEMMLVIQAR